MTIESLIKLDIKDIESKIVESDFTLSSPSFFRRYRYVLNPITLGLYDSYLSSKTLMIIQRLNQFVSDNLESLEYSAKIKLSKITLAFQRRIANSSRYNSLLSKSINFIALRVFTKDYFYEAVQKEEKSVALDIKTIWPHTFEEERLLKWRAEMVALFSTDFCPEAKIVREKLQSTIFVSFGKFAYQLPEWLSLEQVRIKAIERGFDWEREKHLFFGHYFHATNRKNFISIIQEGEIFTRRDEAAYVSTYPEFSFGNYLIVFNKSIEYLSTPKIVKLHRYDHWIGFSKPIPVNSQTVAYLIIPDNDDFSHTCLKVINVSQLTSKIKPGARRFLLSPLSGQIVPSEWRRYFLSDSCVD